MSPTEAGPVIRGKICTVFRCLLKRFCRPGIPDVDGACEELFEILRRDCPHLLPVAPLEAATQGPEIDLGRKAAQALVTATGQKLSEGAEEVIWNSGNSEIKVVPPRVRIETGPGEIVIFIPAETDQSGPVEVEVLFVVGSQERPAGMLAVTSGRVRGPEELVSVWNDAIIAFAWGLVQEAMQALARGSGRDVDGAGLIPGALVASESGIRLTTMARHSIDRRPQ